MLNTRMHPSSTLRQDSPSTQDFTIDVVDSSRTDSPYAGLVDLPEMQKPSLTTFCLAAEDLATPHSSPRLVITNPHLRECLAEFLGTFVMICFGFGVNNQVSLSHDQNGTWLSINMCWGVAVMLGVHCSEGISSAHLNPAATLAMATFHRLSWRKVPGYLLAQCLGAFVGSAAIFALYRDLLNAVDPLRTTSRAHFATYPRSDISNVTAFYTEFLVTAMLLLGVFAITDKRNRPASASTTPLHFMVLIWAIGMAFGVNTGYAINPARDFAPRLFTSLAGWGAQVFTLRDYYFWIPIVAPCLGGIVGAGTYKLLVEMHHPIEGRV